MKKKDNDTAIKMELFVNELFGSVRSIIIDREPWFVGKDICNCLQYTNSNKALLDHVEECDKIDGVTNRYPISDSLGREQYPTWINESGVYSLIFSSKMPKAKEFQHWVTHDILPAMRKIGFEESQKLIQQKYYEKGMYNGRKAESLSHHNCTQNLNELISDLYQTVKFISIKEGVIPTELIYHYNNLEDPWIYKE